MAMADECKNWNLEKFNGKNETAVNLVKLKPKQELQFFAKPNRNCFCQPHTTTGLCMYCSVDMGWKWWESCSSCSLMWDLVSVSTAGPLAAWLLCKVWSTHVMRRICLCVKFWCSEILLLSLQEKVLSRKHEELKDYAKKAVKEIEKLA